MFEPFNSPNHLHPVFLKPFVGGDDHPAVQFCLGDDEAVERVVVDGRQFRRREAGILGEARRSRRFNTRKSGSFDFVHLLNQSTR